MELIFMNRKNSKKSQLHKFPLTLSQRLDVRSSDKHVALQVLSICYMWKNIRKQYKNNKLKIITLTWNNDFELPDFSYSVSDIQDYIEFIKKHENAPSFEVVEVVLFQCNLVGSQYQQKPEVLYTFTPNKSYAYLLNVAANNSVFWKT